MSFLAGAARMTPGRPQRGDALSYLRPGPQSAARTDNHCLSGRLIHINPNRCTIV